MLKKEYVESSSQNGKSSRQNFTVGKHKFPDLDPKKDMLSLNVPLPARNTTKATGLRTQKTAKVIDLATMPGAAKWATRALKVITRSCKERHMSQL